MSQYPMTSMIWNYIDLNNTKVQDTYPNDRLVLCTNNIEAKNNKGFMTKVWIARLDLIKKKKKNIKKIIGKSHFAYNGASEFHNINYWMDLPANFPCVWLYSLDTLLLKTVKLETDNRARQNEVAKYVAYRT